MADDGSAGDSFDIIREEGPTKGRYVLRIEGWEAEMTYCAARPRGSTRRAFWSL